MTMTDMQRIYDKLDEQGQSLARIEERTTSTSTSLAGLTLKVDEMRDGRWVCPAGQRHEDRLLRLEKNGNGITRTSAATTSQRFDVRTLAKIIAAVIGGIGVGLVAIWQYVTTGSKP